MQIHYFEQTEADFNDMQLRLAKGQGYVPQTCLLGGLTVLTEIGFGKDPCKGCNGPRDKCKGRAKLIEN
jgi:hypothetical protein